MPTKRKLQTTSRDSSFSSESPYSKRRRKSTTNQSDLAQSIFDVLKDFEDENGHLISDSFMKLPSKRQNPEYYEKIEDPVDLTKIGQRIRMDEYRDLELLTTDMQLMISNAKKFYAESSQEYTDACNLLEIYLSTKTRILEEAKAEAAETVRPKSSRKQRQRQQHSDEAASDNEPEGETITVDDMKEIYEHLVTETDENGRVIAEMFMQLPDQSNVQYYETIKEPIDFLSIGDKLEAGQYKTLSDFEKDVKLLVKNAKTFNEPNSQIYDDAVTLGHLMKDKVVDIERNKRPEVYGTKFSARIKHRRSWRSVDKTSEKSPVKEDAKGRHDASIEEPDENDFQAQFYNSVINYRNNLGHTISDPFVRLPNKRFYPMYYEEIETPISLKIIRKKLQSKKYKTCRDVEEDFRLLFDNAKQFNVASSQLHKDAVTLLNFMETIVSEYASKEEEARVNMSASEEDEDMDDEEVTEEVEEEAATSVKSEVAETSNVSAGNELKQNRKRKKRSTMSARDHLQEHLRVLYKALLEATDENGREMITLFLEKPSRKDYPDYYKLVLEPIDMKTIDKKIRQDKYPNVEEMLEDFSLMFNNARHYNEPGSEVYNDAEELEKLLLSKHAELGPPPDVEDSISVNDLSTSPSKPSKLSLEFKLDQLFTTVRDYSDPTQRLICDIFMQLPTKLELPDYYKVIRKPMEMDRIQQRMQGGQYVKLEEMLLDMLLMFENACVYNEPGSIIYKDALILQKVAVETFYKLEKIEAPAPANALVQEILTSLFVSVMGHQDENGRCYSESLNTQQSVGAADEKQSESSAAPQTGIKLSLDVVKKNLRNGRYKRLDVFQEQMFEVFEDARNVHRTDSEVYEDAVELQKFFIKIRDELCKNGETLMSPALAFTRKMLDVELDQEKKEKLPLEAKEDEEIEEEGAQQRNEMKMTSQSDDMDFQGNTYQAGDFVYVENPERAQDRHIVCIEKLYTDEAGERRLYGSWFLRPEATYHYPSKKFILKEVFKSDYYNTVPVSLIRGRCFVMLAKDYFKMRPVGYNDEDVFVCESRYSSKSKTFKRIKFLQLPPNNTEIVHRDSPLPIIRMPSCYSENKNTGSSVQQEKSQMSLMQDPDPSWPSDEIVKERENIKTDTQNPNSEATYYSQYFAHNMWLKLGDCVYVRQPNESKLKIARVERMWTDNHANVWLHGPWFVKPQDVDHEPTKMFCKKELFLSSLEDTFPASEVEGKCLVMAQKDYCTCRPTELPEKDLCLYESKYVEQENIVKRIKVKRYAPTFKVVDDEYYYYKKPVAVENLLSPELIKLVKEDLALRDAEAKAQVAQPVLPSAAPQTPPVQGYPPHPVNAPHPYHQPMAPHAPAGYAQPPHMMPQYQPSPYAAQPYQPHRPPGQVVHPPLPGAPVPPQQYPPQTYMPNAGYPSPHPGVPGQHMQPYHNSPQAYPPSPHPGIVASSPGMFQSPQDISRPSSARSEAAPTPPPKKKGRSGHSTGYILFASHCHPRVRAEHPDMAFGEISKIVGEEWRNLEEEKKREFEEKAREQMARLEAEGKIVSKKKKKKKDVEESPLVQTPVPQGTPQPQYATPYQPGQYPNMPQQAMTPQHRMQVTPGATPQSMPPGTHPHPYSSNTASPMPAYAQPPGGPHSVHAQPPPPEPQAPILSAAEKHRMRRGALFVGPPPKAQRVMHSEAYLRYIEGLEKGSKTVSNWEKSLRVKESDVHLNSEEEAKLPVHWLGNGKGQHGTTKAALWALRNFMLKDALTIKNHLAG